MKRGPIPEVGDRVVMLRTGEARVSEVVMINDMVPLTWDVNVIHINNGPTDYGVLIRWNERHWVQVVDV